MDRDSKILAMFHTIEASAPRRSVTNGIIHIIAATEKIRFLQSRLDVDGAEVDGAECANNVIFLVQQQNVQIMSSFSLCKKTQKLMLCQENNF